MVKRFSTKYRNTERAFNYLQSESYVNLSAPDATSLPLEQAGKTNMASVVSIKLFSFMHS